MKPTLTVRELLTALRCVPLDALIYRPGGDYQGDLRPVTNLRQSRGGRADEAPQGAVILE